MATASVIRAPARSLVPRTSSSPSIAIIKLSMRPYSKRLRPSRRAIGVVVDLVLRKCIRVAFSRALLLLCLETLSAGCRRVLLLLFVLRGRWRARSSAFAIQALSCRGRSRVVTHGRARALQLSTLLSVLLLITTGV